MMAYGIRVLFLIREFPGAHPCVTQPWYVDDAGAGGKVTSIFEHLWDLQVRGPSWGYYLEPTKIILVVAPGNVSRVDEFCRGLGIRVVTGHCYLGGYIESKEAEGEMVGRKERGVGGFSVDPCWGLPQAPAVCICRTSEVTPTVVGINAVGDPGHQKRLRPGGEGVEEDLRSIIVRGNGRRRTVERGHQPTSHTVRIGTS